MEPGEESSFDFLVLGPEVDIAAKILNERASLIVKIDLTIVETTRQLAIIETLYSEWIKWPPIKSDTELSALYFGLTSESAQNFIKITAHLNKLVEFVSENSQPITTSNCKVQYQPLSLAMITQDTANIKELFDSIAKSWTSAEIKDDLTKGNLIKHFCVTLTETMENWQDNLQEMISVLDTLGSGIFPQLLMGNYQEAKCLENTLGEKVKVLGCHKTPNAYICEIEVESPVETVSMNILFAVHYKGYHLRGEEKLQQFAVVKSNVEPKILDCDNYDFFEGDPPACKIKPVEKTCLKALLASNVKDSIKNCNFTKGTPITGQRTFSGGILVQGSEVQTKVLDQRSERLMTQDTPIIIFSSNIIILENGEKFEYEPIQNITLGTRIVRSRVTPDDIESLENKYFWENFSENFAIDDGLRYLLLTLQAISYPIIIIGILIGMKLRKRVANIEESSHLKNSRKRNFESNQILLKNIKT